MNKRPRKRKNNSPNRMQSTKTNKIKKKNILSTPEKIYAIENKEEKFFQTQE